MDYYFANNEGHIFCKMRVENQLPAPLTIGKGTAFMQGIFVKFDITDDDDSTGIRTGGMGSTG